MVDAGQRSSLEEVAAHPWLLEGNEEDPVVLPTISTLEEIPYNTRELILHRMEQGGYGKREELLK